MYTVAVDCISVKEIDNICINTGVDIWSDANFETIKKAEDFADICRKLAPLAEIEVNI